ncbi:hypothetical protein [Novacetimonas pomaceti]|uniref:hypothetical protein n=1 Tax=Novacetimonas pomaceti TaxID=2021998 RepID=UPI001C2CF4FE|nr:hypothetical protein [Novacetimonas pomaceti]MBV1833061.1 hypothetical protein [Novacetimonas pomaceti]
MSTPDAPRAAMRHAMNTALAWLEHHKKTDFSTFTVDEAESFFGSFIDAYTFEIMKSWDPNLIRTVGVPARG